MRTILIFLISFLIVDASAETIKEIKLTSNKTPKITFDVVMDRPEFTTDYFNTPNENCIFESEIEFGIIEYNFSWGFAEDGVSVAKMLVGPTVTYRTPPSYNKASCAYQIIKTHAQKHTAIARAATEFFKRDLEKKYRAIINEANEKLKNGDFKDKENASFSDYVKERMQPSFDHIQKKIDEKIAALDTPEMYQQLHARCPETEWEKESVTNADIFQKNMEEKAKKIMQEAAAKNLTKEQTEELLKDAFLKEMFGDLMEE